MFVTDSFGLNSTLREAEAQYEREWGSVKQLVLGLRLTNHSTPSFSSNTSPSVITLASYEPVTVFHCRYTYIYCYVYIEYIHNYWFYVFWADNEVTIATVCVNLQLLVLQSDGEVTVTAVYRFRNSERLLLNTVGKWSLLAGLRLTSAFWDGPDDLQGNLLHFAVVMVRLYLYLFSHTNT